MDDIFNDEKLSKLLTLLKDMDIPEGRRYDLRWISRNLEVRNRNHKNYKEAMRLIKDYVNPLNSKIKKEN